jgi:hypothetical protein
VRRRSYVLTSVWNVRASLARCWDVLADPSMTWPHWWHGVSAADVEPTADGLVGSAATLTFRAPLGYAMRVRLVVDEADRHRLVRVRAAGDLSGSGLVRLDGPSPARTVIQVRWDVATTRSWMNVAGPVLRPLFVASHAQVMRAGERGLAAYLSAPALP